MRRQITSLCFLLVCAIGVDAGSRISITRMGGDIDVPDAPMGASLHTMGGDIRIGRASGTVVAKTMGGNIVVREMSGKLDAGSMGGNIRVRVVGSGGGHDVYLHTMGGHIDVTLPRDFDGTFSVEIKDVDDQSQNQIISDFPLSQTVTERWTFFNGKRKTITASRNRSGSNNRVEISTYGSDVTIRKE